MRKTQIIPFAIASTVLMLAGPARAEQAAEGSDKEQILKVNRTLMDAVRNSDEKAYRAHTVEELRVLAPGGRLEDLDMVIKGLGTVVGKLDLSEENVLVVGDTAILTGKMQGEAVMEPFGKLPTMKFIATFVRTDSGWRMLSRAITPCAKVAIERGVC